MEQSASIYLNIIITFFFQGDIDVVKKLFFPALSISFIMQYLVCLDTNRGIAMMP